MLIKALCDYYDILAKAGKVLPDGYSVVKINYLVCLTPDGRIDEIIDWQKTEQVMAGKGKLKERPAPREVIMPQRTEKSGIDGNIIEHRPLYIFGLNSGADGFSSTDRTDKAIKSHSAFAETNLKFIEGIDSPVVNAFRNFIERWIPEKETENEFLIKLGKSYSTSGFAFCLSGDVTSVLHEDPLIKEKWESERENCLSEDGGEIISQCAVTGMEEPIARIHNKIKGIYGGQSSGCGLVSFNNASENSYGNNQSYNSNISERAMRKYSEALNYLLRVKGHKVLLDDITVVYWAMNENEQCEALLSMLLFDDSETMDAQSTENMLNSIMQDVRDGNITSERIASTDGIDTNVDFYMLGIKPNSSRLAVKFIYHRKFGDILLNVAKHQNDIHITEEVYSVPLWKIKRELISPKSSNQNVDPALLSKLLEAVIYGTDYPSFLLSTLVRRVKTDNDLKDWERNKIRIGVIKGCINRRLRLLGKKEELTLALDKENNNPAYLCGRLFAVLEKLQQDASNNSLNRTIKDAYFASASSKPAITFPKLMRLAQAHLNKAKNAVYFNILIGEIIDKLCGEFPGTLSLTDQGKFIIGYYQQYQNFFIKKNNAGEEKEEN